MNDDQRVNLDISQSTGVFSFQLEGYGVFSFKQRLIGLAHVVEEQINHALVPS